jgi:hypothetical protein
MERLTPAVKLAVQHKFRALKNCGVKSFCYTRWQITFNLKATLIFQINVSNKECGGTFSSESGVIDFPLGDTTAYPHNLSCAYVITTVQSKIVNLTFANNFHIEGTPGACTYDWLQVRFDIFFCVAFMFHLFY